MAAILISAGAKYAFRRGGNTLELPGAFAGLFVFGVKRPQRGMAGAVIPTRQAAAPNTYT